LVEFRLVVAEEFVNLKHMASASIKDPDAKACNFVFMATLPLRNEPIELVANEEEHFLVASTSEILSSGSKHALLKAKRAVDSLKADVDEEVKVFSIDNFLIDC